MAGNVAGSREDIAAIQTLERSLRPLAGVKPAEPKRKKKNGALKRLARLTKMAAMGGRYKTGWQPPERFRNRDYPDKGTVRTQQVTSSLKQAGLTDEEIARMR